MTEREAWLWIADQFKQHLEPFVCVKGVFYVNYGYGLFGICHNFAVL